MNEQKILKKLQKRLSEDRIQHVLAVKEDAVGLAEKYGVQKEKAKWAALLHDCAKELSNDILLQKAEEFGIVIDNVFSNEPELLHAPVGAEIAKREFGIKDSDILEAIRAHTLGSGDMSTLDKVIYLADHIEPNRSGNGIDKLRKHIKNDIKGRNLDDAVRIACEDIIRYHLDLGEIIHPQTVAARNSLLYDRE